MLCCDEEIQPKRLVQSHLCSVRERHECCHARNRVLCVRVKAMHVCVRGSVREHEHVKWSQINALCHCAACAPVCERTRLRDEKKKVVCISVAVVSVCARVRTLADASAQAGS
jgi:hypothetical protein